VSCDELLADLGGAEHQDPAADVEKHVVTGAKQVLELPIPA
jgi:hypothetical protein